MASGRISPRGIGPVGDSRFSGRICRCCEKTAAVQVETIPREQFGANWQKPNAIPKSEQNPAQSGPKVSSGEKPPRKREGDNLDGVPC